MNKEIETSAPTTEPQIQIQNAQAAVDSATAAEPKPPEEQHDEVKPNEPGIGGSKPAPRGSKKKTVAWAVALILLALIGVGYFKRDALLGRTEAQSADRAASGSERKVLYWQDPMHPAYKSDKPGVAPDCGMDLVPVYEGGETASDLPEGAFQISAEKQQLIGVTYGEAAYQQVSKTLRAVGRLAYDETKVSHVHTKIEGWIEDVYVDFVGKLVTKGQPLVSIYSPELLQTQQEFLLARRGVTELSESPFREAVAGSESLYEAARRRLELWDISDEQIKQIEKSGRPSRTLPLYAPATGFVLTRNSYPKQRVMPDTELYTIADLSTIWVIADIYEYEAPEVMLGQQATVTLSYFPGRTYRGTITYIYPQVDAATRTLKVRVEIPNPNYLLKPDMFANVELMINYGKKLVVPQEAVMDAGSEKTVFVALDGGYFQPRKVELGAKVDNKVVVLRGLRAGERIVTSGNFLIDSESRLKSAAGAMGMPGHGGHGGGGGGGGGSTPQEDHSKHQQRETPQAQPQGGAVDHSQHQPKPKKDGGSESVDHSQHQPQAVEDHSAHGGAPGDRSQHKAKPERKVLYWYDPMHPSYRSDKPGKAPDCGMDLVPKYADEKK
jgi:RND family efflux transporter MFP subunit